MENKLDPSRESEQPVWRDRTVWILDHTKLPPPIAKRKKLIRKIEEVLKDVNSKHELSGRFALDRLDKSPWLWFPFMAVGACALIVFATAVVTFPIWIFAYPEFRYIVGLSMIPTVPTFLLSALFTMKHQWRADKISEAIVNIGPSDGDPGRDPEGHLAWRTREITRGILSSETWQSDALDHQHRIDPEHEERVILARCLAVRQFRHKLATMQEPSDDGFDIGRKTLAESRRDLDDIVRTLTARVDALALYLARLNNVASAPVNVLGAPPQHYQPEVDNFADDELADLVMSTANDEVARMEILRMAAEMVGGSADDDILDLPSPPAPPPSPTQRLAS